MSSYYNSELLEIKNIYLKQELGNNIANDKINNIFFNNFFGAKINQGKCNELLYDNH